MDNSGDSHRETPQTPDGCGAQPQGPEVCICAAVLATNGQVIVGRRHGDCLHRLADLGLPRVGFEAQGFLTSRNRYVTRREGRQLQEAAGIRSYSSDGYRGDLLFSEDLY